MRIFLNTQLFLSGHKNFHVHTYLDTKRICLFTRIRIFLNPQFFLCSDRLEYSIFNIHGKELVDLLTRFVIHRGLKNLHSGERIQKVADSSAGYTGYAWTEAESGDSKYPDTCERSLN